MLCIQTGELSERSGFWEGLGRFGKALIPLESNVDLSARIEIAHHDAQHLARQTGFALGDVDAAAELAGLIGQVVVGTRNGGQTRAPALNDSCSFRLGDPSLEGRPTIGRRRT